MERTFSVGDTVELIGSNMRMKVESIDKADGSLTCSWKRGPAMHRKKFLSEALVPGTASASPLPARGVPAVVRPTPQRPAPPVRDPRFR